MSKNVKTNGAVVPDEVLLQPPNAQQEAVIAALEAAIVHQARYMTLDDARERAGIERLKIEGAQKSERLLAALASITG